ncbi:MAG: deoxyribose-phosphate aldolase [Clostridia bacterium]|nr:deoxyribose-phosphate aldolase [Clostridia bacterium]
MDINVILSKCDHTLLDRCATWEDIKTVLDDAMRFGCASACIPPAFVRRASEYVKGKLPICTVIGFPNGYSTSQVKVYEADLAIVDGADEIDMVINTNDVKDGRWEEILNEVRAIKSVVGPKILKVIIETCLLTDEEKIRMCKIVTEAGADFIKTSTGFSTAGATPHDIKLFAENVGKGVEIKAAGGISSLADAEEFLALGATRLGTSRIVKLAKNEQGSGY